MKKLLLTSFAVLWVCGISMGTIFRVNNKLTKNAAAKIYTKVQEAVDEASNGDTIQIEGSIVAYDYFECSKKLVIMGPGYFFYENPGTSSSQQTAKMGSIFLKDGSEGTLIMGLYDAIFYIYCDNITIRRCHLGYINSFVLNDNISNLIITECYCPGLSQNNYDLFNNFIIENLVFINNIIENENIQFNENSTGIFANNLFKSNTNTLTIPSGFDIKNNIIVSNSATNITLPALPRANICNNISTSTHFGTANNNKANVSETSIFLGTASASPDGKYQLKEGSPAKGAGEGGIDIGPFGGPAPYVLSGIPTGPVIMEFNVNTYSTSDSKLSIKIKAKSN